MSQENVSSTNDDDNDVELTLGKMGYAFKIPILQLQALTAPKVIPQKSTSASSSSRNGSRRNKVYATIVSSDEGLFLTEECRTIHIRTLADGSVDLEQCRKHLYSAWNEHALIMMARFRKQNDPLRVFELETLGLKLVCCPDPRPDPWKVRCHLAKELAEDDNIVACSLLMADCGYDLTQVRDIFGPILVMSGKGDDMKLKRLRGIIKSYFGVDSGDLGASILSKVEKVNSLDKSNLGAPFTMNQMVTKTARKQAKGKIPATDLLSHYDGMESVRNILGLCTCGNCGAKDGDGNDNGSKRLKVCKRCEMVFYCSKECQLAHHKTHRPFCKDVSASLGRTKK